MPTSPNTQKPAVLQVSPIYEASQAQLAREYHVYRYFDAPDRAALLAQAAPHVRAAVCSAFAGMDAALINQLPHLELIACHAVGVDCIDLAAARARNIAITHTPDVLTDDVADFAIGLMLAAIRQIALGDRYVRSGDWRVHGLMPLNTRVTGKCLGIVGMGRIGQAIAKRAQAFDMRIAYYGPRSKPLPYRYEPDLIRLAHDSDVLILACSGGPTTAQLVNEPVLEALGAKGCLVNVARGSVVDEVALVKTLQTGRLGSAALDVYADEPNVPPALLEMNQVVLQPHQGSATHETRGAMGQLVLENLAAFFANRPLITPLPEHIWA